MQPIPPAPRPSFRPTQIALCLSLLIGPSVVYGESSADTKISKTLEITGETIPTELKDKTNVLLQGDAHVTVTNKGTWNLTSVTLSDNLDELLKDESATDALLDYRTPTLTVDKAGKVILNTLNLGAGTIHVIDTDSSITLNEATNDALIIGKNEGAGTLEVKHGGSVISNGAVKLASGQLDFATLLIDGKSSVTLNKGLSAESGGTVNISIKNGGKLTSKKIATLGKATASEDDKATTVVIDGKDSQWTHSEGDFKLQNKASIQLSNEGALNLGEHTLSLTGKQAQLVIGGSGHENKPGTLTAKHLTFSSEKETADTQKLIFNYPAPEDGFSLNFSTALSGKGKIEHKQGSTHFTGNSTSFSGSTTISGGELIVSGKLGGTVDITKGGTLGLIGRGEIGTTTIQQGTLYVTNQGRKVNGDLTINDKGTLEIYLPKSPPTEALLNVTGTTTLQASSKLQLSGPVDIKVDTPYPLLKSKNIQGTFGSTHIESNLAFLDTKLDYEAGAVNVTLTRRVEKHEDTGGGSGSSSSSSGSDGGSSGGGSSGGGGGGGGGGSEPAVIPPENGNPDRNPGSDAENNAGGSGQGAVPKRFESEARSRNTRSVANALDALRTDDTLHQFVLMLPEGMPDQVFKALSGDAATAVASALQQTAVSAVQQVPLSRLRNSLQAGLLPGAPLAQSGGPYPVSALPSSAAQPLWAQAFGSWQRDRSDSNGPAGRAATGGLIIGADHVLGAGWRLGGALGYSHTRVNIAERAAKASIDNYSLTLYGGKQWQTGVGQLSLLLGGSYTLHHIRSERDMARIGLGNTLKARYSGGTSQLFTEIGHAFPLTQGYLEPYLGVSLDRLRTGAYTETGGIAALRGRAQGSINLATTLGLRAGHKLKIGAKDLQLRAGLAWRYTGKDLTPRTRLAFQGGGPAFTVQGAPIARSSVQANLSADLLVNRNATLGLGYTGEFASSSQQHAVTLNARWAF